MILVSNHDASTVRSVDLLDRVHFLKTRKPQKAQTSETEHCVEHVNHISRSVGDTTHLRVLVQVSNEIRI